MSRRQQKQEEVEVEEEEEEVEQEEEDDEPEDEPEDEDEEEDTLGEIITGLMGDLRQAGFTPRFNPRVANNWNGVVTEIEAVVRKYFFTDSE